MKKILHIHIPKNGGRSFGVLLLNEKLTDKKLIPAFGYGHNYAETVRRMMGVERYNKYLKTCIVRNPWDRLVSGFYYMKHGSEKGRIVIPRHLHRRLPKLFNDYVIKLYEESKKKGRISYQILKPRNTYGAHLYVESQLNWILDKNGDSCVDEIIKLENIEDFLKRISEEYQKPNLVETFQSRSVNRTKGREEYQKLYTQETKEMVGELYKDDIEYFKYNF